MPTYQYTCTQCGHALEAKQSFTDAPLADCPSCGVDGALRKQYGSVGVVFKGSGFYRTDSRGSNSTELAKNNPTKSEDKKKSGGDNATTNTSNSGSNSKKSDSAKATTTAAKS